MSDLIYYHNSRCSKSRLGLALLEGHSFQIRDYLKDPLNKEELAQLFDALGKSPSEVIRKKEAKDLGLSGLSEENWLLAIAENPILLERPILTNGIKAVIGRPPELISDLIK
jgi:arsenate reductase (glutaredoxin)